MKSNAIYTTSDAGLNRFFGKIYGLVGIGVGLSAVIFLSDVIPSLSSFCQHSHELFLDLYGSYFC